MFTPSPTRKRNDPDTPRRRVMKARLIAFLRDKSGTAAIEYSLIAAAIAVAIITAFATAQTALK